MRRRLPWCKGLAALQPRILAWLGRAGGNAAALVESPIVGQGPGGASPSARWDSEDRLAIEVSSSGPKEGLTLWLDSLLPRVMPFILEFSFVGFPCGVWV